MRLLLDEMISATVAVELRTRGHDVLAVQDPDLVHLRGVEDRRLLDWADEQRRAIVTDNVPDFLACHQRRLATGELHHGLILFTNDTFSRHRYDHFVGQLTTALEHELQDRPADDASAWIRWLQRTT